MSLVALTILTLCSLIPATAKATRNQRRPGIGYVYPAGVQKGQTIEVKLAGRYLDGIKQVVVSGRGVKATLVEHVKPLNGKQINLLRDRMKVLQSKINPKQATGKNAPPAAAVEAFEKDSLDMTIAEMREEVTEIREKLANPKNRNRDNPHLGEDVKVKIVVSPDAEPGPREIRLKANLGLSNPVVFHVSQLPEHTEAEPNNKEPDAPASSTLPLVLNGQIMPGEPHQLTKRASFARTSKSTAPVSVNGVDRIGNGP